MVTNKVSFKMRALSVSSLFLLEFTVCKILAAPNCDLKAIFRTPRRDFDEFEILERSNFDPAPAKCEPNRLFKEDPRSFANAQILLRIGADKDDVAKQSSEPCVPLSKLTSEHQRIHLGLPQYEHHTPILCHQHYNPYAPQLPYAWPNCLYYSPLEPLCAQLMPLLKALVTKALPYEENNLSNKPQEGSNSKPDPNQPPIVIREKVCDEKECNGNHNQAEAGDPDPILNQNTDALIVDNDLPIVKQADITQQILNPEDIPKIKFNNPEETPENPEESVSDLSDFPSPPDNTDKESNIQKIAYPQENSTIDISPLIEETENGKFISMKAIKSIKALNKAEEDEKPNEETVVPAEEVEESKISLHFLEIPTKNRTKSGNQSLDIVHLLNEALVPVACKNCDEKIKNLVSYPIIHRKPDDDDGRHRLDVDDCGCSNSIDKKGDNSERKHGFSADIDDLNIMKTKPIPQASILNKFVPKFVKQLVIAKGLSKYIPFLPKTNPASIQYVEENSITIPEANIKSYASAKCSCKNCRCAPKTTIVYENPTILLEPVQDQEVNVLPTYFSRPFEQPREVYTQPMETYTNQIRHGQEFLVPVAIVTNDGLQNGCSCCTPYERELNE